MSSIYSNYFTIQNLSDPKVISTIGFFSGALFYIVRDKNMCVTNDVKHNDLNSTLTTSSESNWFQFFLDNPLTTILYASINGSFYSISSNLVAEWLHTDFKILVPISLMLSTFNSLYKTFFKN